MSWFHHTKLERFKAQRHDRLKLAQRVQNSAVREEFLVEQRAIEDGLTSVYSDARLFAAYFDERVPPHMERLLNLESSMWLHLKALSRGKYTDEQYKTILKTIADYLDVLVDLLHIQEEVVTSCLVAHYNDLCTKLATRESETRP